MPDEKIKVIIADDHPLIRLGVRQVLEQTPDMMVVGDACNGKEAVELVDEQPADVLLLDIEMPVMDGIQVLEALKCMQCKPIVLILSTYNDRVLIADTLARGAWAYLLKDNAPTKVVEAIRQAMKGKGKGFMG